MNDPFNFISEFIFVQDDEIPSCEVILIPGGSHPQLIERAVELVKNGLAKYILVSGSKNIKLPNYNSEADFLKSIAVNMGILPDQIICETKATNTYENAIYSYELLNNMQINIERFILVCKAFHSRRALVTYQWAFPPNVRFFVSPVTDNRGITKENWFTNEEYISVVMREVEKLGKYFSDAVYPMYQRTE